MKTQSRTSLGARLRSGQDNLISIRSFNNYYPPRQEETPDSYESIINDILSATGEEKALQEKYSMAVDLRQKSFRGSNDSITKLLPSIAGAVQAQFGKKSKEAKMVASIIKTMRSERLVKPPASPESTTEAKQIVHHSSLSYAAMTMHLSDLTNIIAEYNGFDSSNPKITVAGLKQLCLNITNLNNTVTQTYGELVNVRSKRDKLFAELTDRTTRIRSYIKAQYGISSDEYKLLKSA